MVKLTGGFTLPGESGYEELTLRLAKKWGADVVRDSDGTVLSDEILNAGYEVYSTICIIRDHNVWAQKNMDKLQQSFLMTHPVVATENQLTIEMMKDFFEGQFSINASDESIAYWQVYDRTEEKVVSTNQWRYNQETQCVCIEDVIPWHKYTVSFLAYRIWEEISMYNHTTNHWEKEHLMQIDPMHIETREYMLSWMKNWCKLHQDTDVVRFTSLFYNFVWIWGSSKRNKHLFTDWASYDFTVSPQGLNAFEKEYGYRLTAEDFINKGKFQVTHMPATNQKLDYMMFINDFVVSFGKELVDIVHQAGKKAYVFYDDSWIGIEPNHPKFKEFGFDGLIKAVFSGFESRLCSEVDVETHELRLHPYLFPIGVDGSPSFLADGNPTLEAKLYWKNIRRAILRKPIDRIGLGGYLHLVERKPDFIDYIEELANEFRIIKSLQIEGEPLSLSPRIAVLHFWGKLRSWTCSGHFHETHMHDLIHINESLSGLPFDVSFIGFEDVRAGALENFDVIINAGIKGNAWSGGDDWKDIEIIEKLTKWVHEGGAFIGVNEPSAVDGYDYTFRMAHVLGVDMDLGSRVCHGKWTYDLACIEGLIPHNSLLKGKDEIFLTDGKAKVLIEENGKPVMTSYEFGKGKGIYMASFTHNMENTRLLFNTILYAADEELEQDYISDNLYTESAYYPKSNTLMIINNSDQVQTTCVRIHCREYQAEIAPFASKVIENVGID